MTHKVFIKGIIGNTKQKNNAVTPLTPRLPKRCVMIPANGIAVIAPAALHNKTVPNIELDKPYSDCISGSLATQLA